MALSKATGVFAMATSTGNQDIALGFSDGKAIWMWGSTLNTTQDGFTGGASPFMGISDGVDSFCAAGSIRDNQATTVAKRRHDNVNTVVILNGVGTVIAEGVASFSASNLRINWTTVPGTAYLIHYLVLGGSDITGCKLLTFTAKTSTGTEDKTGFGFDPDFVFALTAQDSDAPPANDNGLSLSWGAKANQASRDRLNGSYISEDAAAVSEANVRFNDNNPFSDGGNNPWFAPKYSKTAGTIVSNGIVEMSAFITDGFRPDWKTAAGSAYYYGVMALKGLQYDLKRDLVPTSTGDDTISGLGFAPEAALHWMSNVVSGSIGGVDLSLGMGANTSTSDEHAAWVGDNDGADPTQVDQRSTATYHLLRADPGTPTLDVQASMTTFPYNDDGWIQNFTTAPGTAAYQGWIAFGPAPAAATDDRRRLLAQMIG